MSGLYELECGYDCDLPYTDGIESITVVLVSCVILVMCLCLQWTFQHKELLSHYFEYCFIFTVGAIILTTSLLAWPLNETQSSCNSKPLLLTIGFGLMFGIFVARIRKVWVNFVWLRKQPLTKMRQMINSKRVKREPRVVLAIIVFLELLLMVLFYSVPTFRPKCTCQKYINEDDNFSTCSFDSTFGTLVLCVNLFPIGFSAYFGYEVLKEFRLSQEQKYQNSQFNGGGQRTSTARSERTNYMKEANNGSFNTMATIESRGSSLFTAKSGKSIRSRLTNPMFKSKSESASSTVQVPVEIGEILGVRQDEVDEFQPIFISVSAIAFFGLLSIMISLLSNALQKDITRRSIYYFVRTLVVILTTTIPVAILYARAYTLVTVKQESMRSDEDNDLEDYERNLHSSNNHKNLTVSDRVVKAMASFRGTIPGDSVGPLGGKWSGKTGSSNQNISGGSTNSFFMQFKDTIRQKLTTNNARQEKIQQEPERRLAETFSADSTKLVKS